MAIYRLMTFTGVALPYYNVQMEIPAFAPSPIIRTVNGYFDVRGARRVFPAPAAIRMQGVVASDDANFSDAYLIVNSGNRLVMNDGSPLLIVLQSAGQVRTQVEALRALIGVVGELVRVPFAGAPATHRLTARLLSINEQGARQFGPGLAGIEMAWEAVDPFWTGLAGAASGLVMAAVVGGNAPVRDAILTVTGTTAATRVTGPGIDFAFVGSGQTLVVSGWSALANGAPVAVTLNSGHTADSLVEMAAGATTTLTTVGAASASLTWKDKWV